MSADVRYVSLHDVLYNVYDDVSGRLLGKVWHDRDTREWYAYKPGGQFVGTARTRREATDLILNGGAS